MTLSENEQGEKDVILTLNLLANKIGNNIYFNNDEIKVGRKLRLSTLKAYFNPLIIEVGNLSDSKKPSLNKTPEKVNLVPLKLELQNAPSYIVENLRENTRILEGSLN
jgi:hypothetical protein